MNIMNFFIENLNNFFPLCFNVDIVKIITTTSNFLSVNDVPQNMVNLFEIVPQIKENNISIENNGMIEIESLKENVESFIQKDQFVNNEILNNFISQNTNIDFLSNIFEFVNKNIFLYQIIQDNLMLMNFFIGNPETFRLTKKWLITVLILVIVGLLGWYFDKKRRGTFVDNFDFFIDSSKECANNLLIVISD